MSLIKKINLQPLMIKEELSFLMEIDGIDILFKFIYFFLIIYINKIK